MRYYQKQHQFYCGIDLHSRVMYICIIDQEGKKLVHRNIRCDADYFLKIIDPYREDIVVCVECIYCWYWLADLCAEHGIAFVLGHALYMKAIHGGKSKNDRVDSEKISLLLKAGMIPQAYTYPRRMRSTRDLMRRRLFFSRKRAELLSHIEMTHHQYNLPSTERCVTRRRNRAGVAERFEDTCVQKSIEADLVMLGHYDKTITELEHHIVRQAKHHDPDSYRILRMINGIGRVLSLTILYEIEDINRFPRVQNFISYARLVKCPRESAGKRKGTSGAKMGNVHLKWAFSEAAVLFLRGNEQAQRYKAKLVSRHGKGKALSILAAKLGRAVYFMLKRKKSFDADRFFNR